MIILTEYGRNGPAQNIYKDIPIADRDSTNKWWSNTGKEGHLVCLNIIKYNAFSIQYKSGIIIE